SHDPAEVLEALLEVVEQIECGILLFQWRSEWVAPTDAEPSRFLKDPSGVRIFPFLPLFDHLLAVRVDEILPEGVIVTAETGQRFLMRHEDVTRRVDGRARYLRESFSPGSLALARLTESSMGSGHFLDRSAFS